MYQKKCEQTKKSTFMSKSDFLLARWKSPHRPVHFYEPKMTKKNDKNGHFCDFTPRKVGFDIKTDFCVLVDSDLVWKHTSDTHQFSFSQGRPVSKMAWKLPASLKKSHKWKKRGPWLSTFLRCAFLAEIEHCFWSFLVNFYFFIFGQNGSRGRVFVFGRLSLIFRGGPVD